MDFQEYIVPACLVLIPVLNIIGWVIHSIDKIDNKYIPLILMVLGMIFAFGLVLTSAEWPTTGNGWVTCVLTGMVQGILCAGAAVLANQTVKQLKKPTIDISDYYDFSGDEQVEETK